jgi:hypothetical protein
VQYDNGVADCPQVLVRPVIISSCLLEGQQWGVPWQLEWITQILFYASVPDELTLKMLDLQQWIHRILQGQGKASGYKERVRC